MSDIIFNGGQFAQRSSPAAVQIHAWCDVSDGELRVQRQERGSLH